MTSSQPTRTATRRIPWVPVVRLLVVIALIPAACGAPSSRSAGGTDHAPSTARRGAPVDAGRAVPDGMTSGSDLLPVAGLPGQPRAMPPEANGAVPDGTTVFDGDIPGVANLDPALLGALRLAATDAGDDGVEFLVTSGWRSPEYQAQLLRDAVPRYGSEKEAARWVATPEASAHVTGDAVDIGPLDALAWLSEHGADYGLCQIYRNEPWHYELRPEAVDGGCPPMYADASRDPRTWQ